MYLDYSEPQRNLCKVTARRAENQIYLDYSEPQRNLCKITLFSDICKRLYMYTTLIVVKGIAKR